MGANLCDGVRDPMQRIPAALELDSFQEVCGLNNGVTSRPATVRTIATDTIGVHPSARIIFVLEERPALVVPVH